MAGLPLKLFISYAHEDSRLRNRLDKHLANLKNLGIVRAWYDGEIVGGQEWEPAIIEQLTSADVIVLLISADFLASPYCYGIEMQRAMERHEANEARVIPVLLQPVDYRGAPFDKLEALPTDSYKRPKAVTKWSHREEAFAKVAEGIRKSAEQLIAAKATSPIPQPSEHTTGRLIFDVATIIDYPVQQLEGRFGQPLEKFWRKIGSAEDLPDGGETREYQVGKYHFDINYDKAGIARGVRLFEGLEENGYTLDDWSDVLERVGLIMVSFPDISGITTRIWTNHLGYFVKVATEKVGGPVTAVRVYKIPK